MSGAQQRNMRTFYTLILTQTFSLMGSRISGLALGIWIYAETGNATPLLLVSFFTVLPQVLASSLSGVMADRWDRRYVMVLADAGQALGTLLLLVSFLTGSFQLWHLYAVALIQAIFGVFQGPAFQASVTMLIPDAQRDRANAIQQLTGPMAGIFAPAIAGFIYGLVGVEGAILVDLVTFVVAMFVVFSISIPRPQETEEGRASRGSLWKEVWSGLGYLRKRQTLFFMMLYISCLNFLIGGTMALGTPYILSRTDHNETILGILLSLFNVGAIVGGVAFGMWGGTRPRIHTILPGIIIACGMMIGMGMAQSPLVLGVLIFLFMIPLPMVNASFMSLMQTKTPPDMQGRVFSVMGQLSLLLLPAAYLIFGPLADKVFEPAVGGTGWDAVAGLVGSGPGAGIGLMIAISGALTLVMSLVMYSLPAVRMMEANLPDYVASPAAGDDDTAGQEPMLEEILLEEALPPAPAL